MGNGETAAAWADDFSWIEGRLEHDAFEGGFWSLRFGPDDAPFGGKVVLGNPSAVGPFREGDVVRAEGQVNEQQMSIFMAGTMYEVHSLTRAPA